MNMRKLFLKLVDAGYLESDENSKLYMVGNKVATKRNRQALSGQYLKPVNVDKKDPAWLSAYNI